MSLEAGGYADKLGNRYESNWIAYLLLELLEEKALSVTIEPIGSDEVGVDVVVERDNGRVEHHQCKASNSHDEYWSFAKLNAARVFEKALYQLKRGTDEFRLISPISSKSLSDLCISARNSNGNAEDFIKFQVNVSERRKKDFADFCKYSGIDTSNSQGLNDAFELLQRLNIVQYCDGLKALEELEQKANALYMGDPSKLVLFLKYYGVEQNCLRQKTTLSQLLKDIESAGFEKRLVPEDNRVAPVIERLSTNFIDSIEPYLIANQLISRPEAQEIVDATEQSGVVLIKAEAGMGKSATLLEIHNLIRANGAVSLPIRLDRNRPEKNADSFGVALGFTYSPIYCLQKIAPNQKCFVILDQLDAVRWTASHSNNALEVCKELVRQALNLRKGSMDISIILACRDFEIDEDLALRAWVDSLSEDITTLSLGKLSSELVAEKVKPYEVFDSLPIEKQNVLTIPLWLGIYLSIADEALGVGADDVNLVLDEMLQVMDSESRLSVPEICISVSANKAKDALISVGVLTKSAGQISFRHQALFDYKLGKKLFDAALISDAELLHQLGEKSKQTLTKREHLKYALNMLLAHSQSSFCSAALVILESSNVRFHMKYLVFNTLRELDSLKNASKALINRVFDNHDLKQNFIAISCHGRSVFVNYLSNTQMIKAWLNSDDEVEIDRAIWLLTSIAEASPDTVLQELEPFIGQSAEWNRRVHRALCWNMEDDSDAMFEVRKRLLGDDSIAPFINWSGLAKKNPNRVIELVGLLLHYYREDIAAPYLTIPRNSKGFAHRDKWSESDMNSISEANSVEPKRALSKLLGIIHEFSKDGDEATRNWLGRNSLALSDTVSGLTRGVRSLIQKAAQNLASESPSSLISVIEPFLAQDTHLVNHLNAKILLNLPIEYADFVIEWMLGSPKSRFSCGNNNIEPRWRLAAKLVERFSAHCTSSNLKGLENSILRQQSFCDIESVKWKLEARRRGWFPSFWGEAQHFILPKLPV